MSEATVGIATRNIFPTHRSGPAWYAFLCGVEALAKEDFHLSITPLRCMSSDNFRELLQFKSVCEVVYPLPFSRLSLAQPKEKLHAWLRRVYLLGTFAEATRRAGMIAEMSPNAVRVGTGSVDEPTIYTRQRDDIIQYISNTEDPERKIALDSYHLGRLLGERMALATLPLILHRYPGQVASIHLHLREESALKEFRAGRQGYPEAYLRAIRGGVDVPIVLELGSQNVTPEVALDLLRRVRQIMKE